MPATPSEAQLLRREGQLEGFNVMLTLVSKLTEWDPEAKRWMGLAGDIDPTHRLARGDFANARQTRIENKISKAVEQIRYHLIEAEKFIGRERENHLEKVQTYLRFIRRLSPPSAEVQRTVANVWPWPQMMRAALNITGEGGTASLVTPGMAGMLTRATEALLLGESPPPPGPPSSEGEAIKDVTPIEPKDLTEGKVDDSK